MAGAAEGICGTLSTSDLSLYLGEETVALLGCSDCVWLKVCFRLLFLDMVMGIAYPVLMNLASRFSSFHGQSCLVCIRHSDDGNDDGRVQLVRERESIKYRRISLKKSVLLSSIIHAVK